MVRRESQVEVLAELGAQEGVAGDLRLKEDLRRALHDVRAVYHICPNVSSDEAEIGRNLIEASSEAGVEHLVLHSVLHPQAEQMPHHWNKLRVEEALLESNLNFTILQPAAYMQNLFAGWSLISEVGLLRTPYPVSTRLSLVDLYDVAEVAAVVLTVTGHTSATYELAGTPPLSQSEVAAVLTEALGRPVRAEVEPIEAWDLRASNSGLDESQRAILIKMFRYYERHGLPGNPGVLGWILGREPTSLAEFARRAATGEEFRFRSSHSP
jgi:uncharacterized protein YbjT (DUF2867 family)